MIDSSEFCKQLSNRELQIAELVYKGLTNSQISKQLEISDGLVKSTLTMLYDIAEIYEGAKRVKLAIRLKDECFDGK